MSKSNYCLIDPDGGFLQIRITANNGIRTSSVFILWKLQNGKWVKKEKFNITTADNGMDELILLEKPINIENDSLAWSINACSSINNVDRSEFTITVIQNKKDIWKKESSRIVPKCSDGKHLKFGNHLIFKHLISENISTSDLWKDTE